MSDRQKIMSDLEGLTFDDWHMYHCDTDIQGIATDALELLKSQPEQPRWISVEDKLPDKCNIYLVYFGKGIGIRMKTAVWLPGKRIWKGIEAYSTLNGITHWMPLPEPPKEET